MAPQLKLVRGGRRSGAPAERRSGAPAAAAPAPTPPWRNRILRSELADPTQLLANPNNWRTHPGRQRDALRGSLDVVGWVQQVIVNETTGHLIDGHARIEEALSRGEATVPVLYVDLSAEEEALVLATLDPIGAMADTDGAKLRDLLADVAVDDERLDHFLGRLAPERVGDLSAADIAAAHGGGHSVAVGQTWVLGDHRLAVGDATDPAVVARATTGMARAEVMWTDPPYGVAYEGKTGDRLTLDNDTPAESDDVTERAFAVAPLAESGRFYIAAPSGSRHAAFLGIVLGLGWRIHQELVWSKGQIVLGHSDYQYAHEPILYGYVPGPGRPGRGDHDGTRWYGDHAQSTVLEYPKPKANRLHPTAKPVALVAQCLLNSSRRGDVVYDPFAGSGSTLIACEEIGRRCASIELDPDYASAAIGRWQDATGRDAVLEAVGG